MYVPKNNKLTSIDLPGVYRFMSSMRRSLESICHIVTRSSCDNTCCSVDIGSTREVVEEETEDVDIEEDEEESAGEETEVDVGPDCVEVATM